MATLTLYLSPVSIIVQYLTNLGLMAAGGQVNTYVGGSVNTVADTYTDSTGIVKNPNPLTLSSTGRPASASGAPVAFWTLPGIVLKLVVTDSAGNLLVQLDNIPALNDPTNSTSTLSALLASPASSNTAGVGPVAGVDLVANAIKSYDVIADVRAANQPVLASGQTLSIQVQGGAAINDGNGGDFYWNPTSAATDNGTTVIKPTTASGNGRWLRLYTPPNGAQQSIASASTTDLGTLGTNFAQITGNVTINSLGSSASTARPLWFVTFQQALTLANSANLILPYSTNLLTAAGDFATFQYAGGGVWDLLDYQRAGAGAGADPLVLVATADQSVTNSTVLVNDTALVTPTLVVGGIYLLQIRAQFQGVTATGAGYQARANFSGTLTGTAAGVGVQSANGAATQIAVPMNVTSVAAAVSITAGDLYSDDITFVVLTAGAVNFQFAQNAATANATTRKAGSVMLLTRLA